MHQLAMTAIALSLTAAATPGAAQNGAKNGPADLNAYSMQFWPRNALLRGQTVRADTRYGVLTCTSIGPSLRRQCTSR